MAKSKEVVPATPTLTAQEEKMALDYLSGVKPLVSFRETYPNNNCDDRRARYLAKQILKRPHVVQYIEYIRKRGDVTDQITEESIKSYLWRTATDNPNTNLGLKAAIVLGKEFGIGAETIHIKEDKQYDKMLDQIHDYYEKLERGENPELPKCVLEGADEAEEIEFTIVEEEDE